MAAKIENFTTANGLSSNVVTALLPRHDGTLLIGTQDHGWNLWDGKQIFPRRRQRAGADHDSRDSGRLSRRSLWFATGNGIARCDCNDDERQSAGCSHWMEFGAADGLRSRETATNSHPSAWRSRDGHLWFATPKGLVEVDPAHFPGQCGAAGRGAGAVCRGRCCRWHCMRHELLLMRIPAGHVHFEFDYAGLSFVAPQKVRYRYMLEGFDKAWTEAGARRTAYYTNIPAGTYTFRVQAANNDGVWNTEGAALTFELRPHFYQTLWFYALLILGVVGLVVLVQRYRLKRAEREFNAVLGERNRIAREIHDTLAQGYVGISVQLEVLAEIAAHEQGGSGGQAVGSDQRLCARGAGGCAAIHLGAALTGLGRDDAAGESAAHGGSGAWWGAGVAVQHLRRVPAVAAGHGARDSAHCAGGHP